MTLARCRALLGLLVYAGIGTAAPLADAVLAHGDPATRAFHIEAAGDNDCHHDECVLVAPGAPKAPARSPMPAAITLAITTGDAPAPLATQRHDRTIARPLGPRAPPRVG